MSMKRVQFELSEDHLKELDEMMRKTDTRTKKDLINNALTILNWVITEKELGKSIGSIDEKSGKYTEVWMPFFTSLNAGKNANTRSS